MRLQEIEFFELADVDGKPGAIGWLAHHESVRSLPVALGLRGLRARFGHLQVGVANLFDRAQNRRVTYVRFNAENLHERNRMIDVGARLLVIAALHTMLARCELKRLDQQVHVVSLVHGRTVPLIS